MLDSFCGSGTTVLAAERVGRRVYALELEPKYVDVAIRRWQSFTRKDAVHAETGSTFDELDLDRSPPPAEQGGHKWVAPNKSSNGLDQHDRPE